SWARSIDDPPLRTGDDKGRYSAPYRHRFGLGGAGGPVVPRLTPDNVKRCKDLIGLYPQRRSALIPMLHVAQEQDGWLTPEAMEHVGEMLGITPAEVYGTASFYDMLFTTPVGRHLVSVCTNLA